VIRDGTSLFDCLIAALVAPRRLILAVVVSGFSSFDLSCCWPIFRRSHPSLPPFLPFPPCPSTTILRPLLLSFFPSALPLSLPLSLPSFPSTYILRPLLLSSFPRVLSSPPSFYVRSTSSSPCSTAAIILLVFTNSDVFQGSSAEMALYSAQ